MDAIRHRQNLQELCRACLKTLNNDEQKVGNNLLIPNLCQLFICVTTMDVTRELSKFPKLLCQLCLNRLLDYDAFRKLTMRSTETLYELLKKNAAEQEETIGLDEDDVATTEIRVKKEILTESEIVPIKLTVQNEVESNHSERERWIKVEQFPEDNIRQAELQQNKEDFAKSYKNLEENDDDQLLLPELANMAMNIKSEPFFEATETEFNQHSMVNEDSFQEQSSFETNNGKEYNDEYSDDDDYLDGNDSKLLINGTPDDSFSNDGSSHNSIGGSSVDVKNKFFCEICKKKFYKQFYLDAHIRGVHMGEKEPFKCVMCPKAFVSYNQWYAHKKSQHKTNKNGKIEEVEDSLKKAASNNKYNCDICQRPFSSRKAIVEHIKRHKQIKDHVCKLCGVAKVTRTELKTHMRVHFPDMEKFPCPRCPQVFNHRNAISRHVRVVHEGERRFTCDYCSKKFSTRNSKVCHERLHRGEKPFSCEICEKRFAQPESLKSHMKTHDKSLCKHICSYCSRPFITLKNLLDHEKRHRSDKPHICVNCSKGFHFNEDLQNHYLTCPEGGGEVSSKSEIKVTNVVDPLSSSLDSR
ncbi:uncharacterized protein [Musca autumnalis]|uniref:uncharacterized protein n=1 Tax=Musca autumnalis TaxID=221902 RepID=UPI003CF5CE46